MYKKLTALLVVTFAFFAYGVFAHAETGTIYQLNPWKTSGGNITQNVANTPIKFTGLTPGGCLQLTASNIATTTGSPCGSGSGGSGNVATSTGETAGQLSYWTSTNATPATLGKVATTTLTLSGFPANIPATLGALVGGSNTTWTWWGLATTSQPSSSNLLVSNGGQGVYGAATSSATINSPLSGSLTVLGSGSLSIANAAADGSTKGAASFAANDFDAASGNISIDYTNGQAASGAAKGFLTSADWTTFNGKQAALTFTYPLQNSANTISLAFGTTTANSWSALQTITNSTTSLATFTAAPWFTGITASSLLALDANQRLTATTSIGTNLLTGTLGTINGQTLSVGGSVTVASTTLLADNNTFSGNNTFSSTITGSISGNAGTATALQTARTINGVSFDGTANITITAASSTLLADTNTWSALQTFGNASSTVLSSGTICLDTCRTTWPSAGGGVWPFTPSSYNGVANQSTTTPLWLKDTMVLASTTLFTNASTTGLTVAGSAWFPTLTSALILTDANGLAAEYAGTSCTNQFVRSLNGAGVATCATVDISADTNLSATWPIVLTGDTLSFDGISTSSAPSTGNLAYWTGAKSLGTVATTSLSFSGPFSGFSSLGALVGGSNSTVTWTGLATTSQPASSNLLVSNGAAGVYGVATTSVTIGGSLSYSGTFGALVGGAAGTLSLNMANANSWTALQTFANATSSLLSAYSAWFGGTATTSIDSAGNTTIGGWLKIPSASNPTVDASAKLAIDQTQASSSLRYHDGTAERALFPDGMAGLPFASSTLTYRGAFGASGTTTIKMMRTHRPLTLLGLYCDTDTGTAYVTVGNGSASSTMQCTTSSTRNTTSVTWTIGQYMYIAIGTRASSPNVITVSPQLRTDAD